ncbi:MAG: TRAP transporter small permease subunit [Proteobacteria bacterium]|nr:TRAP transporter small permease subunit [Pseudomonadota bacterium]
MLLRPLALLERVCALASVGFTCLIILVLSAQIFCRYVLNASLVWSEEVATWCMVWVVYAGSAILMRNWQHVHIPIFIRLLPLPLRPPIIILAKTMTMGCAALITYYGVIMFNGTFHIVSQTTGISTGWIKLAVPLGMGAMALFAGAGVAEDLRRWIAGDMAAFERYGTIEVGDAPPVATAPLDPPIARHR